MHILWEMGKGFVKDIIEFLPSPKPAYNTVSTIVRILEKKGFVDHLAYGKTHEYFPLVSKEDYTSAFLSNFMKNYFDDSFTDMVSFFARDKDLSITELEDIRETVKTEIQKHKAKKNE